MPNPSATSKTFCLCSKYFDIVQYFWPCSNGMQIYKVIYHFWAWSKKFERGQKSLKVFKNYWTRSKKFEHGQNIFELADGIGKSFEYFFCFKHQILTRICSEVYLKRNWRNFHGKNTISADNFFKKVSNMLLGKPATLTSIQHTVIPWSPHSGPTAM